MPTVHGRSPPQRGLGGPEATIRRSSSAQKAPNPAVLTTRVVLTRLPKGSVRLTRIAAIRSPKSLVLTTRVLVMRLPNASMVVTCCLVTVLAEAGATEPRAARPRTPDTRAVRMIDVVFMTVLL